MTTGNIIPKHFPTIFIYFVALVRWYNLTNVGLCMLHFTRHYTDQSGEVLAWLCVWSEVKIKNAYSSADATATLSSLAPVKSRMVYTFLVPAYPARLSWKKGR